MPQFHPSLVKQHLQKKPLLLLAMVLLLGISIRIIQTWGNTFPFMFDHARDSLAVLEMVYLKSPTLIGPRASIPGLFFGPLWYYLLAPFNLFSLDPGVNLIPMLLIYTVTTILFWKYVGKIEAVIVSTSLSWVWLSTSAWNPFPLAFITLLFILFANKLASKPSSLLTAFFLGVSMSAAFHFSSAYAIFYPPVLFFWFLVQRKRMSFQALSALMIGFFLLFLPQLLFELRHDFVQTQAVISYISGSSTHSLADESSFHIVTVLNAFWRTLWVGMLPNVAWLPSWVEESLGILAMLAAVAVIFKRRLYRVHSLSKVSQMCLLLVVVPILAYSVLHFSSWYLIGMYPAITIMIARLVRAAGKTVSVAVVAVYLIGSIISLFMYVAVQRPTTIQSGHFLSQKLAAISLVRSIAGEKPFASYHYVPDVYDFPYQYLYLIQAFAGQPLPTEFAYLPNQPDYVQGKKEILQRLTIDESLANQPIASTKPQSLSNAQDAVETSHLLFFIVEKPQHPHLLAEWWTKLPPHEIDGSKAIGPDITVYWGSSGTE